ncbi:MAG: ABC transporter ATP-binding protein/permease [Clostridia bacterium]|nr:ABC transporter ATP-binding protein/permease [Clostridia bacterium]
MFKLYKNLKAVDWVFVVLIVGITVAQVYFTMTLVDYVSGIISAIGVASVTGETGDIWYNGGMMILFAVCSALCQVAVGFIASHVSSDLSKTLRSRVFTKVEGFSVAEVNKFSTASLITRSTNDIQQVQMANVMILRMLISAPITAIWAICKISATSWELTTAAAVAIVLLVIGILAIMLTVLPKFKVVQKLTDRLNGVTRENLTGIRVVRAYNAEGYQEEKFDKANDDFTKVQIFTGRVISLMSPMMTIIMNGITLAIYIIGAYLINDNVTDYASIVSFMMLVTQVVMAFVMLLMMFIMLPRAMVAAKRINEVLDTPDSITDPEVEKKTTETGTVEFRDVSFKYPDADGYVIKDISFRAEKGQTVAFIGSTGSGKSTLINLVPRFYDASDGEILVDGVNVKDLKQHTLHEKIGYVPQKGVLFTGTVAENIGYGGVTDRATIEEAAQIAEADEFIQHMEKGYDSDIAQGGKNVSGGQKQRISIARAVATHPEIMIFDDSFSALDYKTDKKVRENLKEHLAGTTNLIVAQRIGTIMDADKIIVLDKGKAVGVGTHKELLETCGVYKEIALSQLSAEELGIANSGEVS